MLNVRENVAFAYNDVWTAAEVKCAEWEGGLGAFMQLAECACGSCSGGVNLLDLCMASSSIPRYQLSPYIRDADEFTSKAEIPNEKQPCCAETNGEAAHAKRKFNHAKISCYSSCSDNSCCHELVSLHYKPVIISRTKNCYTVIPTKRWL